jgi:hypothetical protein
MPYCIRCSASTCKGMNIFSINFSSSSSARPATCAAGEAEYIPGPAIGSIAISAWATYGGDIWLGTKCKGTAQASQTNIQRYDYLSDSYILIPSTIHKAQIVGDVGGSCSLTEFYGGTAISTEIINGITIASELGVTMGYNFHYIGGPFGVSVPDAGCYSIEVGTIESALFSSFNLSVDFPTPAVATFSYEFPIKVK